MSRRARVSLLGLVLAACVGDASPFDAGARDAGPPPPPTGALDLVFVLENAGGLSEEHWTLMLAMPALIEALVTGDHDGDATRDAHAYPDLQIGFVTTDMGSFGNDVATCARTDHGDDGLLHHHLAARDLVGCRPEYPRFLAFAPGDDLAALAASAACLAYIGTDGCAFEQPLEATLKALSPAAPTPWTAQGYVPPRFFRDTAGHGDGANAGLARDDAILAVVLLLEEDDCSVRDPAVLDPESATYRDVELGLRCIQGRDALHPVSRYVEGMLALRRHPSRLLFAILGGVPPDLVETIGAPIAWDTLLGPPELRDDRMELVLDPAGSARLTPSCNVPGLGVAFPPERVLTVARGLEARGARVVVASSCQESYAGPARAILRALAR